MLNSDPQLSTPALRHHNGPVESCAQGERCRFLDMGEAALVVEFGAIVDPAINDRVLALDDALNATAIAGLRETLPTYRSVMIHYDPLILDRAALVTRVEDIIAGLGTWRKPRSHWLLPCCYAPPFGEDIGQVATALGMTSERIAALHAGVEYRVYMYGFAPGCCYLGGLPPELSISRRDMPRQPHPENSILMAGGLTMVTTVPMPTGWWIIGRTPQPLFMPRRESRFFIEAGDTLSFDPVDRATFCALAARVAQGEIVAVRQPEK